VERSGTSSRRVPPGRRIYAVGDVHGRSDLLDHLHQLILEDAEAGAPSERVVVYLGDYVDRGPNSFDVLEMLIEEPLPGFRCVHLKGNHEDMMLRFVEGPADLNWLINGGDATLASYGLSLLGIATQPDDLEAIRRQFGALLPSWHRRFLEGLALWHEEGDYLFVHAGIRPGVPLAEQRPSDLVWIRDAFLSAASDLGHRVVHGHTISREPEVTANRIGIDTGAFFSDRLTCLVLEGSDVRFLST
jgi:serine/threonine protein phosphatase 1